MKKPTKENYRNYKIWQNTKTVKIEGGFEIEIPTNNYYIVGLGVSCLRKFSSIKKCKEHIDFLIRDNLNVDYRELKGL